MNKPFNLLCQCTSNDLVLGRVSHTDKTYSENFTVSLFPVCVHPFLKSPSLCSYCSFCESQSTAWECCFSSLHRLDRHIFLAEPRYERSGSAELLVSCLCRTGASVGMTQTVGAEAGERQRFGNETLSLPPFKILNPLITVVEEVFLSWRITDCSQIASLGKLVRYEAFWLPFYFCISEERSVLSGIDHLCQPCHYQVLTYIVQRYGPGPIDLLLSLTVNRSLYELLDMVLAWESLYISVCVH